MKRFLAGMGVVLLTIMLVSGTGCWRQSAEYDLVILSPHQERIEQEFEKAFGDLYQKQTGRRPKLSWLDLGGGTSTQLDFIRDQFKSKPDGIGIDVFFGGGTPSYLTLNQEGLLESFKVPNLDEIAPDILGTPLYDSEHHYYGAALSGFGMVYNKEMLKGLGVPEPKTWEAMADPRLFGLVAAVNPVRSGSAMTAYEVVLQAYGWEKGMRILTLMGANARTVYQAASDVPEQVGAKQAAMGCAIDFYATSEIEKSGPDKVGFVLPANLTALVADPIGILKGAPHMETARMFVSFVMSKEGQRLWFLPAGSEGGPRQWALYRMPVIPSLYDQYQGKALIDYDPFKFSKSFRVNDDLASRRRNVFGDLFLSIIDRPHNDLAKAWGAIIKVKDNQALVDELVKPPVTEAELMDLAGKWSDEALRSRIMTEWSNGAIRRYQELQAKAGN